MTRCSFCAKDIPAKYFHAEDCFKAASPANGTKRTRGYQCGMCSSGTSTSRQGEEYLEAERGEKLGVPIISGEEFLLMLEPGPRGSRAAR